MNPGLYGDRSSSEEPSQAARDRLLDLERLVFDLLVKNETLRERLRQYEAESPRSLNTSYL